MFLPPDNLQNTFHHYIKMKKPIKYSFNQPCPWCNSCSVVKNAKKVKISDSIHIWYWWWFCNCNVCRRTFTYLNGKTLLSLRTGMHCVKILQDGDIFIMPVANFKITVTN